MLSYPGLFSAEFSFFLAEHTHKHLWLWFQQTAPAKQKQDSFTQGMRMWGRENISRRGKVLQDFRKKPESPS